MNNPGQNRISWKLMSRIFTSKIRPISALCVIVSLVILLAHPVSAEDTGGKALRWWKGNLHDHTHWSDGDDYPESVAAWYKDRGYHFLSITDHNLYAKQGKWIDPEKAKGGMKAYEKYQQRFGNDWVQTRDEIGKLEVKLQALNEFRSLFEEPGRFLLIPGEEITDHYNGSPVHFNAINLPAVIPPQGGASILDAMQKNVNAVIQQRVSTGQPIMMILNHPNFFLNQEGWLPTTAEDMAAVKGLYFFEVLNGGGGCVHNEGKNGHVGTERLWDIVLTKRLGEGDGTLLYGVATDDAHFYHYSATGSLNPGRGWVMVRSERLHAEKLINAMEAGDFYASTGVTLKDLKWNGKELRIEIDAEAKVDYTIQFIGTRKGYDPGTKPLVGPEGNTVSGTHVYSATVGEVLKEVKAASASYTFAGDELYVRAKVVSSKLKINPHREGALETAWIQPVNSKRQ